MRRRLLVSTLVVAVTAVLLLGLPLAFVLSRLQISAADRQVQRDATTVARTLQNRVNAGLPPAVQRSPPRPTRCRTATSASGRKGSRSSPSGTAPRPAAPSSGRR